MLKTLRIIAPFHNIGGYSHAARGLLAAALCDGFVVEAVESETNTITDYPMDGSPVKTSVPKYPNKPIPSCQLEELQTALRTTVAHNAPTILMGNPGMMAEYPEYCAGPRVGYTMLESDTLQPQWAQACRNVDLLLAPSQWCVDTLRRDVKGVPCELLPICVDDRLWGTEGPKRELRNGGAFLFLSIFSTCERKGWRKTIQAFSEEFRGENVGLVLKPTRIAEVAELADWVRSMGAGIEIIKGELTDDEMGQLYRACDVYVSPSAEGFGVPLVEAALCGLPSVALAAGGTADIVKCGNGYLVPPKWEPCVGQLPQIYPSSHQWPSCSIDGLREQMRMAFEEEPKIKLGKSATKDALKKFSREAIADRLNELKPEQVRLSSELDLIRDMPPFVAIITTHNNLHSTNRLVQSLLCAVVPPCMVVIADDASTDETQDWADSHGFVFVRCNTGGNVSRNRQIAVNALKRRFTFAGDPFVVFLDNDIEVSEGWWGPIASILHDHPDIGILAPRKVYGSGTQGGAPHNDAPAAETVQNIGNRLYFNGGSFPVLLDRPLVYPDYVESACMVVRPEVWRTCEWDAQFPIFYEDVDYCFQARAAGFEVCATASATVIHHAHTTSHLRASESETNRMRFLKKWKDRL